MKGPVAAAARPKFLQIRLQRLQSTWSSMLIDNNNNNNNNTFISPHNIQEIKNFITAVQTMIGALAARNNLRVKNARQAVKRKDV